MATETDQSKRDKGCGFAVEFGMIVNPAFNDLMKMTLRERGEKMATLEEVARNFKALQQEWNQKQANLKKCGDMLAKLKVALTQLTFLPTSGISASQQELLIARDTLEIGALWSIKMKQIPSFERYMAQLKYYYMDYKDQLMDSALKYQLLGLNLLCLLAQNRVAEFHTELELLPLNEVLANVYVKHALAMEQYVMEGNYNKIFLAKRSVPAESFNYFIDILLDTIRDEIAICIERAYRKLGVKDATKMLFFQTEEQAKEYCKARQWQLKKSDKSFHFNTEPTKTTDTIPSFELAARTIEYARELEMIV